MSCAEDLFEELEIVESILMDGVNITRNEEQGTIEKVRRIPQLSMKSESIQAAKYDKLTMLQSLRITCSCELRGVTFQDSSLGHFSSSPVLSILTAGIVVSGPVLPSPSDGERRREGLRLTYAGDRFP